MSYRCLMIVNPARIRCKNEQLLIETEEVHSVPIEDISAIVLESRQSTITTAAMAALAQNGVVTFWCDETHLPCGISLPFAQHSRQLGVLRWQMELTLPAKKRMWQQVVTAKIQNQAECLALCGKTQVEKFNSQMQQLFAFIFVHFITSQQGRQHTLFCWQPIITPILLSRLYHITPFSTIYLYFLFFIRPSCRNAQFPQALPKYDLA